MEGISRSIAARYYITERGVDVNYVDLKMYLMGISATGKPSLVF